MDEKLQTEPPQKVITDSSIDKTPELFKVFSVSFTLIPLFFGLFASLPLFMFLGHAGIGFNLIKLMQSVIFISPGFMIYIAVSKNYRISVFQEYILNHSFLAFVFGLASFLFLLIAYILAFYFTDIPPATLTLSMIWSMAIFVMFLPFFILFYIFGRFFIGMQVKHKDNT